jgi:chemotaxis protein CheD
LKQIVRVVMAEYKAVRAPVVIISLGLGSCVGVALFDSTHKIGGLAHIMLPDSKLSTKNHFNPGKFADTAIDALLYQMIRLGAEQKNIVGKIAGGAQMFRMISENAAMQIGKRNVEAVRYNLSRLNIKLITEDVEGDYGRSLEFNTENGSLTIKTIGHGVKVI